MWRGQQGVMTKPGGTREIVACKMLAPGATKREHEQFQKEYQTTLSASMTCKGAVKVRFQRDSQWFSVDFGG